MIKIKTKAEIRQELDEEINNFLNRGGAIEGVNQGVSGRDLGENLNNRIPLNQEKQTRTLLTETVNALDSRKKSTQSAPVNKEKRKAPKKKIIYDDFGDPLREVWE